MTKHKDRAIAVVTGAAGGIGAAVAEALHAEGHIVVGFDAKPAHQKVPYEVRTVDITDDEQVNTAVEQLRAQVGRVSVLINGAGVLRGGGACSTPILDWKSMLDVNLLGAVRMSSALVPAMAAQGEGVVVTIASNAAAVPRAHLAAYSATKAAVIAYSKCLGLENAQSGVRCNVVAPGSTDTDMLRETWEHGRDRESTLTGSLNDYRLGIPLGRIADAQDIAAVVNFLVSPAARHLTMQTITADGGATLGA